MQTTPTFKSIELKHKTRHLSNTSSDDHSLDHHFLDPRTRLTKTVRKPVKFGQIILRKTILAATQLCSSPNHTKQR